MFPENQWLEDVFSYWTSPFFGAQVNFRKCYCKEQNQTNNSNQQSEAEATKIENLLQQKADL